jgi:hypothetical protein
VIHGALASGGLTKRVVEEAQRLRGVRRASIDDKVEDLVDLKG